MNTKRCTLRQIVDELIDKTDYVNRDEVQITFNYSGDVQLVTIDELDNISSEYGLDEEEVVVVYFNKKDIRISTVN